MVANLIIQGGMVSANQMQTRGGGGQKSGKIANVIYECPLTKLYVQDLSEPKLGNLMKIF